MGKAGQRNDVWATVTFRTEAALQSGAYALPTTVAVPEFLDDALARARVSRDELQRWRELGWASVDASKIDTLDTHQIAELTFVRDVARSGLSDAMITALLSELPSPYEYRSERTAYSFVFGWLDCSPTDVDQVISDSISDWVWEKLGHREWEKLDKAFTVLSYVIEEVRSEMRKDAATFLTATPSPPSL